MTIAPAERDARAVFRIAIPAWGYDRRRQAQEPEPVRTSREEIQRLLDGAMGPGDLQPLRFTKSERRQLAISRRVRRALYGVPLEV